MVEMGWYGKVESHPFIIIKRGLNIFENCISFQKALRYCLFSYLQISKFSANYLKN